MKHIRKLENFDFLQLVELNYEMYKSIDNRIDQFGATNTLLHFITEKPNFVAFGIFEDNVLLGFSAGYQLDDTTFLFTGLYLVTKNVDNVSELIDYSIEYIANLGYKAWEADATNENILSILAKYGAKNKYIRVRKEI